MMLRKLNEIQENADGQLYKVRKTTHNVNGNSAKR
jgi:hypothetical protein